MNNPEPIAVLEEFGQALAAKLDQPTPRARVPVAVMWIALALLLGGFVTLTPPGRAAVDWVGDLIGLGDDTKPETQDERLSNALALGSSEAPGGLAYTVFADLDSDEGLCFDLVFAGQVNGLGRCQQRGIVADVSVPIISQAVPGIATVAGAVPPESTRVEVAYQRSPGAPRQMAPAQLFSLDQATSAKLGVTEEQVYGFFVAFLPEGVGDVAGDSLAEVRALDTTGQELASSPIEWARTDFDDPALALTSCTDANTVTERFCR